MKIIRPFTLSALTALVCVLGVSVASAIRSTVNTGDTTIKLVSVWTRIGDSSGAVNKDNDTASIESAEFSPDGKFIVSGSKGVMKNGRRAGQAVKLWRAADGKQLWSRARADEVEVVAFSPDARFVAAGGEDGTVEILRPADGNLITTLPHKASIDGIRFSHNGKFLLTGTEAQEVNVWRVDDYKLLYTARHGGTGQNAVNSLDFTRDDRFVVSGGTNGEVKVWLFDQKSGRLDLQRTMTHGATVKSVRISPDEQFIASGGGRNTGVKIWNFADGRSLATLPAPPGPPKDVTMETIEWTPDGKFLVTGGNEGKDKGGVEDGIGYIRFYRTSDFSLPSIKPALQQKAFRQEYYHFTSGGRLMLSSHEDGTLRLWKVETIN